MKNLIDIIASLNIADGCIPEHYHVNDSVVCLSKRASREHIVGAVVGALNSIDIYSHKEHDDYHHEYCEKEIGFNVYSDDDLSVVVEIISDFGSKTEPLDKTFWFVV